VWKRYLLLTVAILVGASALGGSLLKRDRVLAPKFLAVPPDASMAETINLVDSDFRQTWRQSQLTATPKADEWTLIRRISLGLMGTVPSLEELRSIEKVPAGERVTWWLGHVLEDRRSADYLAERLARAYVGTDNGTFVLFRRRRLVLELSEGIARNESYDQIVRSLMADSGLWTDTPTVNFVTARLDMNNENQPDPIRLAAVTSRAFLGMRIDCLQCHDEHRDNKNYFGNAEKPVEGKQSHFHQLAAFYSETYRSDIFGIRDNPNKKYFYKYIYDDKESNIKPQVPFYAELYQPTDEPRRKQLANWVTHSQNGAFSRAIVNRLWAILCGKPLVTPIDDVPLYGPWPAGLDLLAKDFSSNGFDLRRLIRLIIATEAFQRDSRAEFELTDKHEETWASFPVTRLRPEQVAGALTQAASLTTINDRSGIIAKLQQFGEMNGFVERYGDMGVDEFIERGGTVTQRLLMMNGEIPRNKTQAESDMAFSAPARISALVKEPNAVVEAAYLCVLSRKPSDWAKEQLAKRLESKTDADKRQAIEDLYWELINSTEFSWNH
jgi:Protein of unknown function (DUF1553)/Protein of unknown function (DUF1549)